ncbi:hypothetical protein Mgra_00008611 [Meloidogyne graminicola]|uniref:Uncharacterized protein n=1 Tax=Meloidogyne graminicola TaxID=189291 RepID=A0A8S9ZFE0_9BILA|nr:hypothetical protein Mgra_00008611 [Meloidogyne graminicola]
MSFLYFRLFSQFITVSGAINAPILYLCSSEYRKALNKEFPWLKKFFKKLPAIYPDNSLVTNIPVTTVLPQKRPIIRSQRKF